MTNSDPTLFDDLRRLDSDCPGNRHDKLVVLIAACIEREIDTRRHLIAVLSHLGYSNRHVVMMPKTFLGSWWRVDDQQRYSLLI